MRLGDRGSSARGYRHDAVVIDRDLPGARSFIGRRPHQRSRGGIDWSRVDIWRRVDALSRVDTLSRIDSW